MYRIAWARKAQKQLLKAPVADQVCIADAVDGLAQFRGCRNVKALTNHAYGWRLRVERWRVLFDANDAIRVIRCKR